MKLTWYGHSCFLLETAEGSVVFDPYAPGSVPGLELPPLRADLVLCSHEHGDHGWRQGVSLTGREPGFRVERISCFHDGRRGLLRGKNTIHIVEAEGLRAAHLGDLGHELNEKQLAALGRIDLLLIPVGGHYTIDAETAHRVAGAINARIVVPMHYRGEGFGYDVIGPVGDFLRLCGDVRRFDGNVLEPEAGEERYTALLRCPTA